MRTFYREKQYRCGEYLDVYVYPVHPCQKAVVCSDGRRRKRKPTSETKQLINQKAARDRVVRLTNANFTENDLAMTLTYRDGEIPESQKEADREFTRFIRRAKALYKKAGIECKWIAVTEGKRWHHHLVISGGIDRDALEKLWGHGYANTKRLQFGETGVERLAHYMTKGCDREKHEKSYRRSRNLVEPEPKISDSRIESRKRAERLADQDGAIWAELYEDYTLVEVERFNESSGMVFLFARMYLTDGAYGQRVKGQRRRRRNECE